MRKIETEECPRCHHIHKLTVVDIACNLCITQERLSELEEWTRKSEDYLFNKINTMRERINTLEKQFHDAAEKLFTRVEIIEEKIRVNDE
jgi:hypothetical protein